MSEILHIRKRIFFILTKLQKCGFQSGKTMFFSHFLPFPVIFRPKQGFSALESTFLQFRQNKKICSLICKISDIFCLAKYDLQWSWFFDFYLWVSKFLNLQNCIKTCFNYLFSFSQFISSLSRTFFGCQQIQMFTPGIG